MYRFEEDVVVVFGRHEVDRALERLLAEKELLLPLREVLGPVASGGLLGLRRVQVVDGEVLVRESQFGEVHVVVRVQLDGTFDRVDARLSVRADAPDEVVPVRDHVDQVADLTEDHHDDEHDGGQAAPRGYAHVA